MWPPLGLEAGEGAGWSRRGARWAGREETKAEVGDDWGERDRGRGTENAAGPKQRETEAGGTAGTGVGMGVLLGWGSCQAGCCPRPGGGPAPLLPGTTPIRP